MALLPYLRLCYKIVTGKASADLINTTSFVVICAAHLLKAFSIRIKKVETNQRLRQTAMVWFSALQRSVNMDVALALYRDVHTVLCYELTSDEVENAKRRLVAHCKRVKPSECDNDDYDDVNVKDDVDNDDAQN
jgi:hypothetical protein